MATTLVMGTSRGRVSWFSIQIGSVTSLPAVKVVTMISSKLSAKASMPPATKAVRNCGKVTSRKVCHRLAPRSIEASCMLGFIRRRRANTLLNTMTMQKVSWAMIMPK